MSTYVKTDMLLLFDDGTGFRPEAVEGDTDIPVSRRQWA